MKVDAIQSNQQNFGAHFVKNDNFCRMIKESSRFKEFDNETIALVKEFAQKNKEHELVIDKFELLKADNGDTWYELKILNTGKNIDFGTMMLDAIRPEGRNYCEFPLKTFLKNLLGPNWKGLFSYDEKYDTVIHDLLGKKTNIM